MVSTPVYRIHIKPVYSCGNVEECKGVFDFNLRSIYNNNNKSDGNTEALHCVHCANCVGDYRE